MYECLFGMFPSRCGSGIRDDFRTAEPLALTLRVRSPDFTPPVGVTTASNTSPTKRGLKEMGIQVSRWTLDLVCYPKCSPTGPKWSSRAQEIASFKERPGFAS